MFFCDWTTIRIFKLTNTHTLLPPLGRSHFFEWMVIRWSLFLRKQALVLLLERKQTLMLLFLRKQAVFVLASQIGRPAVRRMLKKGQSSKGDGAHKSLDMDLLLPTPPIACWQGRSIGNAFLACDLMLLFSIFDNRYRKTCYSHLTCDHHCFL